MAEDTAQKQPAHLDDELKWQPGQSGNPAGRPKGARNKLGEAFIQALHDDFNEHGVAAVEQVRIEKPDQYLKVIASLLPKEHRISFDEQFDGMSDADIAKRIHDLTAAIAPFLVAGDGIASEGVGGADSAEQPSRVH